MSRPYISEDNFQIVSNLFYRENQGFQAAKFVGMKENT